MSKQVAKAEERPSYLAKVDSKRGQENVGAEDLIIPRLGIIQATSPQRKKSDPAYIEGAEDGILFNTVTNELYGTQIFFVPVLFVKEWLIWKSQNSGGGFQGSFVSEMLAQRAFDEAGFAGKVDSDGKPEYEVVDTMNHFGLIFQNEKKVEEVCVSMAKSKAKVSRQLNTLVKMAGGDRFSRVYKISAVEDQNKQGKDFYNIKVSSVGYVSEVMFKLGEIMYNSLAASSHKVAYETEAQVQTKEAEEY